MSQAVKRACDACHRRKVKCDGLNPCRNCGSAQLSCTYNAIPQKKGPKGSRAKVISELRETQRQTSLSAKVQNRIHSNQATPPSPSLNPTTGLLTGKVVKVCVDYFFENMYPTMPILDRGQVEQQIPYMEQHRDTYIMLASLCALVAFQPGLELPDMEDLEGRQMQCNVVAAQVLIEEALRVRKGYDFIEPITYNALVANFFLLGCSYALEMHDKAWYYLREATTMIHLANMNDDDQLRQLNPGDAARRRRLYWLFYSYERVYAIQRHRPVTLQPTIAPPTEHDDPNEIFFNQLQNFVMLMDIYRLVDDPFMAAWKNARSRLSGQLITSLHKSVEDCYSQYFPDQDPANLQNAQNCQEWIKELLWNSKKDAMSNNGTDNLAFQYGVQSMAQQQMRTMATSFPSNGMESLAPGFIEKLLETCNALMALLPMLPTPSDPFARSTPIDHLKQLVRIITLARAGNYHFLPLLVARINEILPQLVNPVLQTTPETSMPLMPGGPDMFDGFGTAGIAQVPQMQMAMESNDFERKFSPEEYQMPMPVESNDLKRKFEDYQIQMPMDTGDMKRRFAPEEYDRFSRDMNGSSPESNHTNNTQQNTDMTNAFVGSPAIMSPGMEYSQNMNNFACTPMQDMMSPLATPGQPNQMNQMQGDHQQHVPQSSAFFTGMNQQSMNGMFIPARQQPQRQTSYQMQGQPSMGNYNSGGPNSMGPMGMDFSTLS